MNYLEIGFTLGVILYTVLILGLVFSNKFRKLFYIELFEGSMLGDIGEDLFYQDEVVLKEQTFIDVAAITALLVIIHSLLLIPVLVISSLIGPILIPIGLLGVGIGLPIYNSIKNKKQKLKNDSNPE